MKTYIINLDRSTQRRAHITAEAEKCGLDYSIVSAVDGSKLSDTDISEYCDVRAIQNAPNWLTKGMLGCALSHYNVYLRMLEDDVDAAFVLEDDVRLPQDLGQLLNDLQYSIAKNEIISLYYFSFEPCVLSTQNSTKLSSGYRLHYPLDMNQPITTAGYVVSREAAKSLSEVILPVRVSPDSWGYFYDQCGFGSFRCVFPVPLSQSGAKSDINNDFSRSRITRFIDEKRVPLLNDFFRFVRLSRIRKLEKIEFVDRPSPVFVSSHPDK